MRKLLALALALMLVPALAQAASITTLFAHNNFGNLGGATYFTADIGLMPIEVTSLDVNVGAIAGTPFTWTVYTTAGGHAGRETNMAAWTQVATGSGTAAGLDQPSAVTLNSSFVLNGSTTYGIAMVAGPETDQRYTNGTGANQFYANSDLSLTLGTASNVPFTAPLFSPRVWNGTIYYDVIPEPASLCLLLLGGLALRRR